MLYGDRVTLRAMSSADYPRMTEFKNDVEVELLSGGAAPRPRSLAMLSEFFDELVKEKDSFGFVIEADGTCIGDIGLFHLDRLSATAEVGIGIGDKDYWGKGYGREAMRLIVEYGFRMQNLRKIWLETHATNERALRCYQAVGFVEEGLQRSHVYSGGEYVDLVLMGLLRTDWDRRGAA
ncbi:GNAT family N-acetyltransferase [Jatrophihabitans telluris]|uniref:GNAT family N-acetyltransferase n=1 Tax=Jatrophihabitans telluris TaxID=2038343 RepID=A0ABY4QZ60_9ACTN|nr:GNAT family protein [Jatrophihabitans telluris]UQX88296.1 GNAT family N-acetyltransferase [Jatrophihabitans telluris]